MNRKERKNKKQNPDFQYEEMEKVEEFGTADFLKGVAVGVAIGSVVILT